MKTLERLKLGLAKRLHIEIKGMFHRWLKATVVLFTLFFSGLSVFGIYQSVVTKKSLIRIEQIHTPKYWKTKQTTASVPYSRQAYRTAVGFKEYMESLQRTNPCRRDSILKLRPHLLDSVLQLIQVYKQTEGTIINHKKSEYETSGKNP